MEMDVKRIVFTGGPAGGKTTIINMTKKYLESKGYNVIIVLETATELIPNGYNMNYVGSINKFQNLILDYQRFKENITNTIVKNNTVILYDRGVLDNKAYFKNTEEFDYLMQKNELNEIDILDNYDLVIDLVSTAVCDEKKYTTKNNKARHESVEEARMLDYKTAMAWVGHENMFLFNSNYSIYEEFLCVIDKINQCIKNNVTDEKISISIDNTLEDFSDYNDNSSRLFNVEEITLNSTRNYKYIIKIKEYKNNKSILLNTYKDNCLINSKKINNNEYLECLLKYKIEDIVNYKSLNIIHNLQPYEIKFYDNKTVLEFIENKLNKELIYPERIKFFDKEKKYVKL